MKNINNDLKTYIDLLELIEENRTSHVENRQFGLAHQELLSSPVKLLTRWVEKYRHHLSHPPLSQKLDRILSTATLILLIVAFVFGIFSGIALLSYSGSEPVNLIYFLGAVFLLPLLTMTTTLFAMWRANLAQSRLIHLSPAYWMERMLLLLSTENRDMIDNIQINPLIANWIVIRRSQELALAFSLGLFLALLGIVASQDIAFGWSTTLKVTPETFHQFLSMIALPWKAFLPEAVPSLMLIEQSHYFRLGGALSSTMVDHAALLGEWWKFLAMTTLTYALVLRFVFFLLTTIGLKSALKRAMLAISGVRDLLREIEEPLIETEAVAAEDEFKRDDTLDGIAVAPLNEKYTSVIGWALDESVVSRQNDRTGIAAAEIYEAGGSHTLEEDQRVVDSASGNILLYVKSWEPPTLDFIDFLMALAMHKSEPITVYPLGTPQSDYQAAETDFDIWEQKISTIKDLKIRMVR